MNVVHTGTLSQVKSLEELRSGLASLHRYYGSTHDPSALAAMAAFENEIWRRTQKHESGVLHNEAMGQSTGHHKETMGELGQLKSSVGLLKQSVDRLARPRWIDWAIFLAGAVAAAAGVILLFRAH